MKKPDQSKLNYLLTSRPLILKRHGHFVCLHDAFSGEVLAGQNQVQLIQEGDSLTRIVVEFICDGEQVRLGGEP